MNFQEIHSQISHLPFIDAKNARILFDFIRENNLKNVLELGIAHGKSSCYIAAALENIENSSLTCVDLLAVADHFQPSAEQLFEKFGFNVDVHRMESGYNWFLHDEIKKQTDGNKACKPKYDLIIIDGPKNWTIDTSSFFLCEKLLNQNGWIVWDDYHWTYAKANESRDSTDGITHRQLSEQELTTPHIKEIFELCVLQHPQFGNFRVYEDSDWAWAQKSNATTKTIAYKSTKSVSHVVGSFLGLILKSITKKTKTILGNSKK